MECFKCLKKGHYADKCPESKAKDGKGSMKMGKIDDFGPEPETGAKSSPNSNSVLRHRG